MSETQTEPETDAEPTPGPWQADVDHQPNDTPLILAHTKPKGQVHVVAEANQNGLLEGDWKANARLIAAAGTAAQEAKEMGYDAVAVQKALPKILSAAEELLERVEDDCRVRNINPYDEPSFTALEYALKSAEGSGDE